MASQDGQPDRILRGCAQPTLAQDLPEPAAGPPAGGALEAAAAVRPPAGGALEAATAPPETGEHTRCVCCGLLAAAPQAGACQSCRAVDKQRQHHGRRVCPRRRSWPSIYQQVTEQRQQNPDSRLKWETVEAAYKETLQRFQRRTTRSSRGGPFLPMDAPWLRRRTGQEGQLRGTSPTWTHQLEIRDQGPAASPALRAAAGGPAAKCLPRAKPPPSGPAAKHPPNPASHPSCRRRSRRCPARRPSGTAAANLLPALCPTSGPAAAKPARAPASSAQRPCRCQAGSCSASSAQRPCRCQLPSSAQRPCRCQAGSCSASSAQRPCRCQLPSSAQRSCRSSQAMRDASRMALNQHFCACARVVPFCNFVCYTFC